MQISYLHASDLFIKDFSKLAKQAETIRNYRKQIVVKGLGHGILGNFCTDQMVIELTKI